MSRQRAEEVAASCAVGHRLPELSKPTKLMGLLCNSDVPRSAGRGATPGIMRAAKGCYAADALCQSMRKMSPAKRGGGGGRDERRG